MANQLQTIIYKYSDPSKILQFCPLTYSTTLDSGVEQTLTIPDIWSSNSYNTPRIFACINIAGVNTASVVVTNNSTATAVPASFTQGSQELATVYHEVKKEVKVGDVLHFLSDTAAIKVNVLLYIVN